jgi:hypothetical protein
MQEYNERVRTALSHGEFLQERGLGSFHKKHVILDELRYCRLVKSQVQDCAAPPERCSDTVHRFNERMSAAACFMKHFSSKRCYVGSGRRTWKCYGAAYNYPIPSKWLPRSRKSDSRSASQQIRRLLWNKNVRYCVHCSPSWARALRCTPSHTISLRFILVIFFLPSMPRSYKLCLPFRFSD